MKNILMLMTACLALTAAGCSASKKTIDLEGVEGAHHVRMKKGDTYAFKVRENPSTGYAWSYSLSEGCSASVTGTDYKQDKAPEMMVGVGGERTFNIKAHNTGSCTITLKHARGNDTDVAGEKLVHIDVE